MEYIENIIKEWAIVSQAPMTFIVLTIFALLIGWTLSKLWHDGRIGTLEERIKLRDDQLSGKFQATSPDEAMLLMRQLQERVEGISQHGLNEKQREMLRQWLSLPTGTQFTLDLVQNGFPTDPLLGELTRLFNKLPGWSVVSGSFQAGPPTPSCGILFAVADAERLTAAEALVMEAFRAAGLAFEVSSNGAHEADVRILVSLKYD